MLLHFAIGPDNEIAVTTLFGITKVKSSKELNSVCRNKVPLHILEKRVRTPFPPSLLKQLERNKPVDSLNCPAWSPELLASSHINNRSISPWTYRINKDHERIPERIPEAVCLCQGCISFEKMKHTLDYTSVPVTANMQVYRRTSCKKGQFQYKMAWIEIAVACTCVFPKVTS
eukprot:gi/632976084/ref/XP_007904597.1/ PREDICTED: interleukin-17C-like [Callorhinchus milii]